MKDGLLPTGEDLCNRHTLPVNGPDPIVHLFLYVDTPSARIPKTGLSAASPYQAHALRALDHIPIPLILTSEPSNDGRCRFWEIDPHLMPGLYGMQIPPALRPKGYTYIYLSFPDTHPHYLELQAVYYDPYDSFALGLETWIRSSCHENLSSGLRKSMPSVLRPLLVEWLTRAPQV